MNDGAPGALVSLREWDDGTLVERKAGRDCLALKPFSDLLVARFVGADGGMRVSGAEESGEWATSLEERKTGSDLLSLRTLSYLLVAGFVIGNVGTRLTGVAKPGGWGTTTRAMR